MEQEGWAQQETGSYAASPGIGTDQREREAESRKVRNGGTWTRSKIPVDLFCRVVPPVIVSLAWVTCGRQVIGQVRHLDPEYVQSIIHHPLGCMACPCFRPRRPETPRLFAIGQVFVQSGLQLISLLLKLLDLLGLISLSGNCDLVIQEINGAAIGL